MDKKHKRLWALILVIPLRLSLTVNTFAEELTLDTVLSEALANSPLVAQIDSSIADELGRAVENRTLPNPELDGELRSKRGAKREGEDDEYEIALSQPFRLSHLGLRQAVATLIEKAAREDQRVKLQEFVEGLRISFVVAWAREQRAIQLDEAVKRTQSLLSKLKTGSSEGLLPHGEVKLIEAEAKRLVVSAASAKGEALRAKAELMRQVGAGAPMGTLRRPIFADLRPIDELLAKFSARSLLSQSRVDAVERLREKEFSLAKRDAYPLLSPRIGFEHTDDGDDQINVALSIALPFFDRNQGDRLRKQASLLAARRSVAYLRSDRYLEEIKALHESSVTRIAESRSFESEIVPALKDALVAFETQRKAGQGVLFQIWETQRELNDAYEQSLDSWIQAETAKSELRIITGEE